MLIKYVTRWNELGLAFTLCGANTFSRQSLECFETAITIYDKIQMHCHMQMALGDYILNKLVMLAYEGPSGPSY